MAWDQAKMNKNEPNYEQLNFKLEILERERERERERAYLSCVSPKYQKSYEGLLILIIVSNKLDDHK